MNFTDKPPFDLAARGRPVDDLDGLLRAFFQAELPHPWPEPPARTVSLAQRPRWTSARSHLALAASVVLLLTGLWALAGKFPAASPPAARTPEAPMIGKREKPYETPKVRVKETLIQDREEGTRILIEIFDK